MASTDATPLPLKNTAFRLTFPMWLTTGLINTGASGLDTEISIDGGTFADATDEAHEIASGSGTYYIDLTNGEMNGDTIAIQTKSSTTNAITAKTTIYPSSGSKFQVNATQINSVAASSVTTINANLGTTQPVNFTGTGGSALAQTDVVDIAGSAVSASTAQLGVNVVQINGVSAVTPGSAGGPLISGSNPATTFDSLAVTNALSAGSVSVANDVSIAGTFGAGNISIGSGVTIGGNLQITGTFNVTGTTTWTGPVTFSGGLTAGIIVADITGNITGTLSTVTALTNLPSIPANWLTATSIASGAITSAKFATGALDAVWSAAARTITGGTITTYTGNTPQTGDSFARIGVTGSGLTSLAPSSTALSTAVWTNGLATSITTIAASAVKIQAATYDSTTPVSSSAVILSNGATYTVTSTGRTIS